MMRKVVIHSSQASQGVDTYPQVIQVGDTAYLSGHLGIDPEIGQWCDGYCSQAHQDFRNLWEVCLAAGVDLPDTVSLIGFLTDMSWFAELKQMMSEYFSRLKRYM